MKYLIKIQGGFSGIPSKYEGEIALADAEAIRLMQVLQLKPPKGNPALRDALNYRITLQDRDKEASGEFSEMQLPDVLREFLDRVRREARH